MKLKPDLIRDLLLYSESLGDTIETDISTLLTHQCLSNYSWGELFSAISILGNDEARLIDGQIYLKLGGSIISHVGPLSYKGRDYLNLIRDTDTWAIIKEQTGLPPGSITLTQLADIAQNKIRQQ